jgi:hypothetical protein
VANEFITAATLQRQDDFLTGLESARIAYSYFSVSALGWRSEGLGSATAAGALEG